MASGMDSAIDSAITSIHQAHGQMQCMGEDFSRLCQHRLTRGMATELTSFLGPAITYKTHVLPQSVATMTAMKDVLEYYRDMSFGDWEECLDLIKEDAKKGYDIV